MAAGKALQLKFISKGYSQTLCRINDVLLREKQQIEGFIVDYIGEHSVIVHRDKYRFELRENHAY